MAILAECPACHMKQKAKNKLEHSNFCQWYQLLKRDDEIKRTRAMKKAAWKKHQDRIKKEVV